MSFPHDSSDVATVDEEDEDMFGAGGVCAPFMPAATRTTLSVAKAPGPPIPEQPSGHASAMATCVPTIVPGYAEPLLIPVPPLPPLPESSPPALHTPRTPSPTRRHHMYNARDYAAIADTRQGTYPRLASPSPYDTTGVRRRTYDPVCTSDGAGEGDRHDDASSTRLPALPHDDYLHSSRYGYRDGYQPCKRPSTSRLFLILMTTRTYQLPPYYGARSRDTFTTHETDVSTRGTTSRAWHEYMLELRTRDGAGGGRTVAEYQFPQTLLRAGESEDGGFFRLLRQVCHRAHLAWPRTVEDAAACLQHAYVLPAHDSASRDYLKQHDESSTVIRVYTATWPGCRPRLAPPVSLLPPATVMRDKGAVQQNTNVCSATIYPHAPPSYAWLAECEMATHVHMGNAEAYGVPIARHTLRACAALPVRLRFASKTPPLVLYHGTSRAVGDAICAGGLKLSSKVGMLGSGLYLAKWRKATKYTAQDSLFVKRSEPGVVVRCIVFPTATETRVMTRDMLCACGCAREFVDHLSTHAEGYRMSMVPDDSLPATRHAEWCVKDIASVFADAVYASSEGAGTMEPSRTRSKW